LIQQNPRIKLCLSLHECLDVAQELKRNAALRHMQRQPVSSLMNKHTPVSVCEDKSLQICKEQASLKGQVHMQLME